MNEKELTARIKELREKSGWSQELLAEKTKLSLRTIQRIESGKVTPRGNTLLKLKEVLNDELPLINIETHTERKNLLTILNLSALSYIAFPILNFILPGIIWLASPLKTANFNNKAKKVILTQILWSTTLIVGFFIINYINILQIKADGTISATRVYASQWLFIAWVALMYLINLILIISKTLRASIHHKDL